MSPYLAAVVGYPVDHSLSPEIFKWIAQRLGKEIDYQKVSISPEALSSFLSPGLTDIPFLDGWNVTAPYKEKIAQWLKQSPHLLSEEAAVIEAVNVVKRKKNSQGKEFCQGYNTDCRGIIDTFQEHQAHLAGQEVLVYGAGGAALAACYALGKLNVHTVWLSNREEEKTQQIVQKFSRLFPKTQWFVLGWQSLGDLKRPIAAYIQATSLGMNSQPGCVPLPTQFGKLTNSSIQPIAFDLIYRPLETAFLKACQQQGLFCLGGIELLIWQAIATWEIWFGPLDGFHSKLNLKHEIKQFLIHKIKEN